MKALKIFRISALIAALICLLLSLVYNFFDIERDWYAIISLVIILFAFPTGLIVHIKNESSPAFLATTKKGMLIVHDILLVIVLGVFVFCFFDGIEMSKKGTCFFLGAFFMAIYQICGNIIVHKLKKAYDSEN